MTVGIRGHSHVAALIISIGRGVPHRIGHLEDLILDISFVSGMVTHPVALAGIEAVAVHYISLDIALGIGSLDQLASFGIFVGYGISLGVGLGYQAALPIIFHRTLVALGISDGCAVTRVVIGISGSVASASV